MTRTVGIAGRREVAAQLSGTVFRLRRSIRASGRTENGEPELPDAQIEVIRQLKLKAGIRVQDVADRLGIAANTASTLVGQLTAAGLVERARDANDARVSRLYLTARAKARMTRARDRHAAVVADALGRLDPEDRDAIAAATGALGRLLEVLEIPADRT